MAAYGRVSTDELSQMQPEQDGRGAYGWLAGQWTLHPVPPGKEKGKDSEHADDSETKSTGERRRGAGSMKRIPHWMRHFVLSGGDFFVLIGIVLSNPLLCAKFCYMVRVQKYT